MNHFYKTELGLHTLQHRNITLNAKQRRLLILIGSDDFNAMRYDQKQRIADIELLQQLLDLGLIAQLQNNAINGIAENKTSAPAVSMLEVKPDQPQSAAINIALAEPNKAAASTANHLNPAPTAELEVSYSALDIESLQQLMIQHLQQYCGLMAKSLIEKIKQCRCAAELKSCQMQWITYLQESRISDLQLNQTLQQINFSLNHMQHAEYA